VPPVRDRIVERAVLAVVTPVVDPLLGPWSYAYRPGLGVADAVQALARLRDEGLGWVARADVADCFPTIPVPHLKRLIAAILDDGPLLDLIGAFLGRASNGDGGVRAVAGLPQGSPLSPLWANLMLTRLDERMADAGFPTVRYSDDLAAAAATKDEAWEAMRVASDAVGGLEMRLGADKSEVMSFAEGFTFLGEDFGPRYPPVLDAHRAAEPARRILYAGVQGSRVRLEAGRLLVESGADEELLDVPSGLLERLVCFGAVGVSAGVRSWALANNIDMVFLSRRGSYLGQAWGGGDRTRVFRLRAQLAASDDGSRSLPFGRAVIEAKIRKQAIVLRRLARRDTAEIAAEAAELMTRLLPMLPDAAATEELMGVEGAAARAYFGALGVMMPDGLAFEGRSRQPPLDVVNAALSYGYAILAGEAVSALCAAGLDPAIGLLHADADRRPSLALDLMEEFRPLIVDQVVTSAIKRGTLVAEHGRHQDGVPGVLLTRAGREAVIDGYEKRMLTTTRGALPDFSGSLRRHLYRQAERVAAFVHDPTAAWTGLSWR
jgi:CRISPR-associated protein Cas1